MTRVSPSIAERCRIFSNITQEENDQNLRRLFYQDGTTQTASGIPVPVSTFRKEPPVNPVVMNSHIPVPQLQHQQSFNNDLQQSSLPRIQRKFRSRWDTSINGNGPRVFNGEAHCPNEMVQTSAGCFTSHSGTNNTDTKQSLETAIMNFSAEDVTTTADETDESKVRITLLVMNFLNPLKNNKTLNNFVRH